MVMPTYVCGAVAKAFEVMRVGAADDQRIILVRSCAKSVNVLDFGDRVDQISHGSRVIETDPGFRLRVYQG